MPRAGADATMPDESWTPAVANAAFWAPADAAAWLQWLLARTSPPPRLLAQFLHCATWRATFHSRVGAAVTLITLRARRRALAGNARERAEIVDDLHRALAAEAILRPLGEGLAFFAEFDIAPGGGTVRSQTMTAALGAFGLALQGDRPDGSAQRALQTALDDVRRSPALHGRKAGLFARPLADGQGSLAGYLAVKALWGALVARVPAFEDKDQFLAFLQAYVHEDAEFVRRLLVPDLNPPRLVTSLARRLGERLAQLEAAAPGLLQAQVAAWQDACAAGAPVAVAMGIDATTIQLADDAAALLLQDADDTRPMGQFALHALMTLRGRAFNVLGYVPAQARLSATRLEVAARGDPDLRFEAPCDAHSAPAWLRSGPVTGDLVAAMPAGAPAMVLYFVARDVGVPVFRQGPLDGVDPGALQRHVVFARHNETIHHHLDTALNDILRGPRMSQWRTSFEATLRAATDDLYARLATLSTAPGAAGVVLALLRQGGVLALLDNDLELVKALAAIGLANTSSCEDESIARFAAGAGVNGALLVRARAQAAQRHGMPLLDTGRTGTTRALV